MSFQGALVENNCYIIYKMLIFLFFFKYHRYPFPKMTLNKKEMLKKNSFVTTNWWKMFRVIFLRKQFSEDFLTNNWTVSFYE